MIEIDEDGDLEYLAGRAKAERVAASNASSKAAQAIHYELARQYAARAARFSNNFRR